MTIRVLHNPMGTKGVLRLVGERLFPSEAVLSSLFDSLENVVGSSVVSRHAEVELA